MVKWPCSVKTAKCVLSVFVSAPPDKWLPATKTRRQALTAYRQHWHKNQCL